jgi:drug/metabolite transporter (DMT)-like permease
MRFADLDPRAYMGVALGIATVALTPFALADPPATGPPGEALAALLVLGLLCTAAAFVLFGGLVAEVGPGRATVITYIAPVVAVALGVTILDEHLGAGSVAGLALILAGSWLATGGAARRSEPVGAADDLAHDLVRSATDRPEARVP